MLVELAERLDGAPRLTDGNGDGVTARDPGAFESPAVVPVAGAPAGPPAPAPSPPGSSSADHIAPVLSAVRTSGAKGRVRFASTEAAIVGVRIQHRVGSHWRTLRTARRWTARAGANRFSLPLPRGTYRLVLTPTDVAGNVGRPARARFVRP